MPEEKTAFEKAKNFINALLPEHKEREITLNKERVFELCFDRGAREIYVTLQTLSATQRFGIVLCYDSPANSALVNRLFGVLLDEYGTPTRAFHREDGHGITWDYIYSWTLNK